MTENVQALSCQAIELEQSANSLRHEVEALKETLHYLEQSEATATQAEELSSKVLLIAPPPQSAGKKTKKSAKTNGKTTIPLPDVFLEDMKRKAEELWKVSESHGEMQREQRELRRALSTLEERSRRETTTRDCMRSSLSMNDGLIQAHPSFTKKAEDLNNDQRKLAELYHARETLQGLLQGQTEELERLAAQLQDLSSIEEQREEGEAELAGRLEELHRTTQEVESLLQLRTSKERILDQHNSDDEEETLIKHVEHDRRVANDALERQEEAIRQNLRSMKFRAVQIAKLEKRLEVIGDAVGGGGISEQERVDVEQLDDLLKERRALQRLRWRTGARMDLLDADIEDLEYRSSALQRTTECMVREMKRVEKRHKQATRAVKKEVRDEEAENRDDIGTLEEEIVFLKKMTQKR